MQKIPRIYQKLEKFLKPNKVLVIFGPRQVGKTTLLQDFLKTTKLKYKLDTGEDVRVEEALLTRNIDKLAQYASGYSLIVIDEAQKIKNIGEALKILADKMHGLMIIVTGSSSFELAGQVGEPLTGRKTTLTLFPISQKELLALYNIYEMKNKLEEFLIFGSYPEVLTAKNLDEKKQILNEITGSYLLKDILELERVKNSKTLLDLLRLLAFQIGSEVSLSELGAGLGIDYKTVARYIDLLEKSFIIYNLRGFSKNLRKEITKKSKYYFYDVGIRNSIIANFNSLELRDDIGKLWENFIIMERLKKRSYQNIYANDYFWRTWEQKEIDLVEEREGKLFAYELKWGNKIAEPPKDWIRAYPKSEWKIINKENYLDFVA